MKTTSAILMVLLVLAIGIISYALFGPMPDFQPYEDEANLIADRVRNGDSVDVPFTLGSYTIKEVGVQNEVVFFWTKLNPSGSSGLVQDPEGHGFNLWSAEQVSDDWAYIVED